MDKVYYASEKFVFGKKSLADEGIDVLVLQWDLGDRIAGINITPNAIENPDVLLEALEQFVSEIPDTVEIGREDLEKFIRDSSILRALQTAGVDNWEGFHDAINSMVK